ncbi:IRF tryptophan pentad repeat domain-containing protein [Nephila pilipes]|uniref:IRF tryptophan pentad repeat domain-containing protein n=1 Tax=Nephila pilipes TaxID=299642 RepID=A0A8X6NH44_NEPPI|nr:IRF tryptophan pentad repeat domain-containing protein [Nephila pilipes]
MGRLTRCFSMHIIRILCGNLVRFELHLYCDSVIIHTLPLLYKMPAKGRKFLTEFLVPNLNTKKFGSRLMWLDIDNKIFQIQWNHKAAGDWKESDAAVFAEWDKKKGRHKPNDKEYFSKSKQRFRAALYKFIRNGQITQLRSKDKHTKIYCFGKSENEPTSYDFTAKNQKLKAFTDPEELLMDFSPLTNDNHVFQYEDIFLVNLNGPKEVIESEEQVVADSDILYFQDHVLSTSIPTIYNKSLLWKKEISNVKKAIKDNTVYINFLEDTDASILKNENNFKQSSFSDSHDYDVNIRNVMWSDALEKVELLDQDAVENKNLIGETTPEWENAFSHICKDLEDVIS